MYLYLKKLIAKSNVPCLRVLTLDPENYYTCYKANI